MPTYDDNGQKRDPWTEQQVRELFVVLGLLLGIIISLILWATGNL